MHLYQVIKRKDGKFGVHRETGNLIAIRSRVTHAEEVADCLELGKSYPSEKAQVLRDWAVLHIEENETAKRKYKIVDDYGIFVRSFVYKHLARWWLRDYEARKAVAKGGQIPQHEVLEDDETT